MLTVDEASVLASGKEIQYEGGSVQAGSRNSGQDWGISWSCWLLLCTSGMWALLISCEAWGVLLQMLSQATSQSVQIIPFDLDVERNISTT